MAELGVRRCRAVADAMTKIALADESLAKAKLRDPCGEILKLPRSTRLAA
jgi:hypothetical protein